MVSLRTCYDLYIKMCGKNVLPFLNTGSFCINRVFQSLQQVERKQCNIYILNETFPFLPETEGHEFKSQNFQNNGYII